jgi:hypothetical protein
MNKCCLKYNTNFCPECGSLLKHIVEIKNYEFGKVSENMFYTTQKNPSLIKNLYICLNEKDFKKRKVPIHRINAFIQDLGHDWFIYKNKIKLSPSGYEGEKLTIIIEY